MNNPVFEEHMRACFINFIMIRLHLSGLAIITFLIFLFYPSQPISYFLARSVKPEMFNIALYTVLTFLSYLTVKSSILSIQNVKIISIKDWFLYTKISVMTFLWGKVSFGLFYTAFLTLLFIPLVLVSGSVSAIGPLNILAIILYEYLLMLNLYFTGLFFYTLFRKQHWVLTLIIWFLLVILVFLSPTFFPESHPALLLMILQQSDELSTDLTMPVSISLISIISLLCLSWLSVFIYRRSLHD